jgi:hypothetical protein
MERIKLSNLTNEVLTRINCWRVEVDTIEDEDISLTPAIKSTEDKILPLNGEVWCQTTVFFSNGEKKKGSCMCRADSEDGPLLVTVWNGAKDVSLIMPPAPEFVLEMEGPNKFCSEFQLEYEEIFPLRILVVPIFETPPNLRQIIYQ